MAERGIFIVNKVWRWIEENYNSSHFQMVLIRMGMKIYVLMAGGAGGGKGGRTLILRL